MRRAPLVLGATVAGTAALMGFHAHGAAVATSQPAAVSTTASTTPATTSTARSTATARSKAYTGAVEQTQYGPVQVKVTVRDGRVVDATAVQLPGNDPRSVQKSTLRHKQAKLALEELYAQWEAVAS